MATKGFNHYLSAQIYTNLVPSDDFFRQLNKIIDWYELTFDLKFLANNDHGGRPRYTPEMLFKMLFLSFLYNISDRDTEEFCSNHIRCKYFIGLDITEQAPDHSSLCIFRQEILERFGAEWLKQLFQQITSQAIAAGLDFGRLQSIDATHTIADVNTHKDKHRQEDDQQPARDPEASWGCKGQETKLTPKGEKVSVNKYFLATKPP